MSLHLQTLDRQPFVESWFYDDNTDPASSDLLTGQTLLPELDLPKARYERNADNHVWDQGALQRITEIKNAAIQRFLETDHEALFLVDSDLLLPKGLVEHLWSADKQIIAAVFYTFWTPVKEGPNVWDLNPMKYTQDPQRFKKPGHYKVGGLGACTLIRRQVLEDRISFKPIFGVEMWGEDRAFSIRASVHGYNLIACSHMMPFHVYTLNDLEEGKAWLG